MVNLWIILTIKWQHILVSRCFTLVSSTEWEESYHEKCTASLIKMYSKVVFWWIGPLFEALTLCIYLFMAIARLAAWIRGVLWIDRSHFHPPKIFPDLQRWIIWINMWNYIWTGSISILKHEHRMFFKLPAGHEKPAGWLGISQFFVLFPPVSSINIRHFSSVLSKIAPGCLSWEYHGTYPAW